MTAIVILGMHRSGTSCLAGMLVAGGVGASGEAVRNWDNARGHHEMLDLVRLDEAVLAHSGGHWLSPPANVTWTDAHAAERDRLLARTIDGQPALLKDPRMLLVLPFWRASAIRFHAIGIARHPLAVARSLEAWREMPLAEGLALWTAHGRALVEDRDAHRYPVIDFDAPKADVVTAVLAAGRAFGAIDAAGLAAAYEDQLVHHDSTDAPEVTGLDDAVAIHRELVGNAVPELIAAHDTAPLDAASGDDTSPHEAPSTSDAGIPEPSVGDDTSPHEAPSTGIPEPSHGDDTAPIAASEPPTTSDDAIGVRFPRARFVAFTRALDEGNLTGALAEARAAVLAIADGAAVLVPVVTALIRRRALAEAAALIEQHASRLESDLASLLLGKILLAKPDAAAAVPYLERASAVAKPYFQARLLLAQALRGASRTREARDVLVVVVREALYPHGPLSTLAEWSWHDGARGMALAEMAAAIDAAPTRRRGRLRTRRAEWLIEEGDPLAARRELELAIEEDPGYARSREVLAKLTTREA